MLSYLCRKKTGQRSPQPALQTRLGTAEKPGMGLGGAACSGVGHPFPPCQEHVPRGSAQSPSSSLITLYKPNGAGLTPPSQAETLWNKREGSRWAP